MHGSLSHVHPFFMIEDICIRLTKLVSRKGAHAWICDMLIMLCNVVGTVNYVKPLYR